MNHEEHIRNLEELRESIYLEYVKYESMLANITGLLYGLKGNGKPKAEDIRGLQIMSTKMSDKAKIVEDVIARPRGFKFDPKQKMDRQVILAIKSMGRAAKKGSIDALFHDGGKFYETRHALRRLKKAGKIALVSLGGSKRYTFWAPSEWINNKGKISNEHTPIIDNEPADPQLLDVQLRLMPVYIKEE